MMTSFIGLPVRMVTRLGRSSTPSGAPSSSTSRPTKLGSVAGWSGSMARARRALALDVTMRPSVSLSSIPSFIASSIARIRASLSASAETVAVSRSWVGWSARRIARPSAASMRMTQTASSCTRLLVRRPESSASVASSSSTDAM
jgi:hypothetical protein